MEGANHYSSVCKPLLARTRNNYWFECERILLSLSPPIASRHLLGEIRLVHGCSSPKKRHVPTRSLGCGWGRYFYNLLVLQALLLQVYPSDEAIHDILIDISMLLIQVIEVQALLIQDIRIKLIRRVIERGLPLLLQLRHLVGDHRLQVLAIADELTHLVLSEIA